MAHTRLRWTPLLMAIHQAVGDEFTSIAAVAKSTGHHHDHVRNGLARLTRYKFLECERTGLAGALRYRQYAGAPPGIPIR